MARKKRFIFDENYIKKHDKKDKLRWLIIGVCSLVLIIVLIVVLLVSRNIRRGNEEKPVEATFTLKEEVVVESGSNLPDIGDYFTELENMDVKDIEIIYPEEFELSYDMSKCSDEEIEKINSDNSKIEEYSCVVPILKAPATYGITLKIKDKEYTVNLKVVDTTAPVVLTKNVEIFAGDPYELNDFINQCYDLSDVCDVSFVSDDMNPDGSVIDYSKFSEVGEYTVKLKAVDAYGNTSDAFNATLKINEDNQLLYRVTFDSDGGSEVKSLRVPDGEKVSMPEAPTKDGYNFVGWYRGNNAFDFNTPINSNITLKAKWEKVGNQGSSGNSGGTTPNVTSIALNYKTIYIYVGESKTVSATVKPSNIAVSWSSSDNSIATVNNGVITGVRAGSVKVTATAQGKQAVVDVIIKDKGTGSCQYGDSSYNTNLYTLSVNLTNNGCAINPNSNPEERLSIEDRSKANAVLQAMGINVVNNNWHRVQRIPIKNTSGRGLVGYQIVITLYVIDQSNPYYPMSAEYVLRADGSRIMRSNSISKNGIKFQ